MTSDQRSFSIAFGWIGLVVGGFVWILYWGAAHLPKRGETEAWRPEALTTLDAVLLVLIPLLAAAVAGRIGRKWLP